MEVFQRSVLPAWVEHKNPAQHTFITAPRRLTGSLRLMLRMETSQMACLYWVLTHLRIKWEGVGGPRLPIRNRAPNRNPNRCFRVPVPSLIPTYPHLTEASFFSPILLLRQTSTNCNQLQPTAGSTRRSNPYPRATRSAISVRSAVKPTAPSPSRKVTEG